MNLLDHYSKLWFFNAHRMDDDNYRLMREYFAKILIDDIESRETLRGKRLLDVGGARGEFCSVFNKLRGCDAVNLDIDIKDPVWHNNINAPADNMPFSDEGFDCVICRGVLEHIETERQQKVVDEIYRVTKKGGVCYIMIPPWFNPHAGHAFRPFHVFGFKVAKHLAQKLYGKKIEATSFAEKHLYGITFTRMLKMVKRSGFKVSSVKDVHFRMHFLTKIPLLREVAVAAAGFILVK
jgi:ubiquinone/menaquinone biosynthesis C-methylase UbiE